MGIWGGPNWVNWGENTHSEWEAPFHGLNLGLNKKENASWTLAGMHQFNALCSWLYMWHDQLLEVPATLIPVQAHSMTDYNLTSWFKSVLSPLSSIVRKQNQGTSGWTLISDYFNFPFWSGHRSSLKVSSLWPQTETRFLLSLVLWHQVFWDESGGWVLWIFSLQKIPFSLWFYKPVL